MWSQTEENLSVMSFTRNANWHWYCFWWFCSFKNKLVITEEHLFFGVGCDEGCNGTDRPKMICCPTPCWSREETDHMEIISIRLCYTSRKHLPKTRLWVLFRTFFAHGGESVLFWILTHIQAHHLLTLHKTVTILYFINRDTLTYTNPETRGSGRKLMRALRSKTLVTLHNTTTKRKHIFMCIKSEFFHAFRILFLQPTDSAPPLHLDPFFPAVNQTLFIWEPFPFSPSCFPWISAYPLTLGLVEMPALALGSSKAEVCWGVPDECLLWVCTFCKLGN